MPSPSPNGMSTPMIELRSRARAPSQPMIAAAMSEPTIEPVTTSAPMSRAAAAPANESSAMPWTANAMSRCITKTPTSPPTSPSTAPGDDGVPHEPEDLAVHGDASEHRVPDVRPVHPPASSWS